MKFRFSEIVKITKGFYRGYEGVVIRPPTFSITYYVVLVKSNHVKTAIEAQIFEDMMMSLEDDEV